ncbi:MAG: hypothetical protein K0U84_10550 [Actinomycetia bacterium]|nr:hypothetical protein [Actinomycetes bacterium]
MTHTPLRAGAHSGVGAAGEAAATRLDQPSLGGGVLATRAGLPELPWLDEALLDTVSADDLDPSMAMY